MDEFKIKDVILDTIEASLEAQLRAVRRLRTEKKPIRSRRRKQGMSQVDMAYDILQRAKTPLHVSEIIERIEHIHDQKVDRESLVSALVKKVQRQDRFVRTDKNVFGLIEPREVIMLIENFTSVLEDGWHDVFAQKRTHRRAIEHAPVVKKPGKRATQEQKETYRKLQKEQNLSVQTVQVIKSLRQQLDVQGAGKRVLLAVVDGSFCNRTVFKAPLDRVELVARCRKDARLCNPAAQRGRRKYALEIFTPEQIRKDSTVPWKRARIHYAGKPRWIRYKSLDSILWRRGAGIKPLRLIVIAPQPYKLSKHSCTNYRQPGYVLATDQRRSITLLIQKYFDRWQIEVNHRDEKSLLGVGQAQGWSALSIPRHPAFAVASYSMLLLAAMQTFGTDRTTEFCPLPKWRKNRSHYSTLDLLTLLRKEINNETSVSTYINNKMSKLQGRD